jgi:DNA-binding response OmpR family regulator
VDDDRFLSSSMQVKLTKEGYDVQAVSDGIEVADKLKRFTPDVILLDLMMPKLDGFAVLEMLKADARLKNIPVIVVTGLSQDEDVGRVKAMGAVECINKNTMAIAEVLEKVKAYLV